MSYVLEVKEASDGELSLNLPEEIHNELGWIDGDLIEWNVKGQPKKGYVVGNGEKNIITYLNSVGQIGKKKRII